MFGKQYNLGIDRGKLSEHIAAIVKANIQAKKSIKKPFLANQSTKVQQKTQKELRKARISYQNDFHNKQAILEQRIIHGKYRSRKEELRKNSEPTNAVNLTTLA